MPRVSLLLADGVAWARRSRPGLEELLLRRRIRRILVLCPAMLQRQWKYELRQFSLDFEVIDSESTFQLRRRLGIDTNPWKAFRIITSMDYLRMPDVLGQFLQASGAGPEADSDGDRIAAHALGFPDRGRSPSLRPAGRRPVQPADEDAAGDPLPVRAPALRPATRTTARRSASPGCWSCSTRSASRWRPTWMRRTGRTWPRSASAASRTTSTASRSARRSPTSCRRWS